MQIIALAEVSIVIIVASSFNHPLSVIKVARSTLRRAEIKLYLFVSCSPTVLPFKSAYFKLLVLIRRRKQAFASELKGKH